MALAVTRLKQKGLGEAVSIEEELFARFSCEWVRGFLHRSWNYRTPSFPAMS